MTAVFKAAEEIDPQFQTYIIWAFYSAMRRSEILNMEWKDVITPSNGEVKIHIPISKSDKARQIPYNKQMMEFLNLQHSRRSTGIGETKIFCFSSKTIQRRMDKVQ